MNDAKQPARKKAGFYLSEDKALAGEWAVLQTSVDRKTRRKARSSST